MMGVQCCCFRRPRCSEDSLDTRICSSRIYSYLSALINSNCKCAGFTYDQNCSIDATPANSTTYPQNVAREFSSLRWQDDPNLYETPVTAIVTEKMTTTAAHPMTWLDTKNRFPGLTSHTICRCIDRARINTVLVLASRPSRGSRRQRNVLAFRLPQMSAISPPLTRKEPDQAQFRLECMSWGVIRSRHCSGFAAKGTTNPSCVILAQFVTRIDEK